MTRILGKTAEFLIIATLVSIITYSGEWVEIHRQLKAHLKGR